MESNNPGTADETNSRQQILERETIKKTTVRTKTRKLIENPKKKIHQKKLSSHKFIKKPTRKRDVITSFSVYPYLIVSYNC